MHKGRRLKIIRTNDGSPSLLLEDLNETYHSTHGALTESQYVFIEKGLETLFKKQDEVFVFEIGFGTGLNALLTLRAARKSGKKVNYCTLEAFPLSIDIVQKLEYDFNNEEQSDFLRMHQTPWEESIEMDLYFTFTKVKEKWQEYLPGKEVFDLVYYDAFAPSRQAEMWELSLLEKMKDSMKKGAVMVTYCAQGAFKRNLKSLSLNLETLPGPPGKAEMVRVMKEL